jgi:regulator of protease activity HflC (stomatin/prohibitin superfamily)
MAKSKPLSAAEIKALKKDLSVALKNIDANLKPYQSEAQAAAKALAAARKEADKIVASAQKESMKLVLAAQKTVDGTNAKLIKASAAAEKGKQKIQTKLLVLDAETAED